jgi:hypothetical protein
MRGRWRNFEYRQSEEAIVGSACSPIRLVLSVTLSGCIVPFSSESVPIHTFCSQEPSLANNHNDPMHTGRCPLGMRVADPLVHPRRPSLKQEFAREFTLPVFSKQTHHEQRRDPRQSVRKALLSDDGRGQRRACQ